MKKTRVCAWACSALMCANMFAGAIPAAAEDGYQSKYQLSNPNANEAAMRTYDYICESFGSVILSAQQESTWMGSVDYEMDYIEDVTGKLPAIRGLDFMNDDFDGVVERAIDWNEKGGIVTICWHCGVEGAGYTESLGDDPDFDKLLTEGTDEYNAMIASWDNAANALLELQEAGVTVLWRPFHEFDGQWFWWGKGGSENFVKLWRMMYDYFTDEYGLNNLIWVLGYSGDVKDGWYPGDEYCDVIGSDSYSDFNKTNSNGWSRLLDVTDADKPLAFHECGNLASAEDFTEDGCMWAWFMVWHSNFITDNDKDNLTELYNSELVITLDELPDLDSCTPYEDSNADSDESSLAEESDSSEASSEAQGESDSSDSQASSSAAQSSASQSSTAAASSAAENSSSNPSTGVAAGTAAAVIAAAAAIVLIDKRKK